MKRTSNTITLITLGCSKNVVDSEVLLRQMELNRWTIADKPEDANIAVINTCGFIEAAKHESIETILQAVERKKEGKLRRIVVMGCLSERYAAELRKEIPEVDVYIGANKMSDVVRALGGEEKFELLGERKLTTPSHFAYCKISEGCDNPCSFCAIPIMRGKHVSKPMERILLEAHRLATLGVKELILIAQDSTYYGLDLYGERRLASLLGELSRVEGIAWIRLMYAYPAKFPLDILDEFRNQEKICRYLDIPIQHIADPVLKSMRRGISASAQRRLLETIRRRVPGIALRTTLIVGYPNEGEREFRELYDFVREFGFERLGVFTYSREDDTGAYTLDDPIPLAEKEARRDAILELQRGISLDKNRALIGSQVRVLVDDVVDGASIGRTERDAPEVDNEVTIHGAVPLRHGHFFDVTVVDAEEYDLFAIPEGNKNREPATLSL